MPEISSLPIPFIVHNFKIAESIVNWIAHLSFCHLAEWAWEHSEVMNDMRDREGGVFRCSGFSLLIFCL